MSSLINTSSSTTSLKNRTRPSPALVAALSSYPLGVVSPSIGSRINDNRAQIPSPVPLTNEFLFFSYFSILQWLTNMHSGTPARRASSALVSVGSFTSSPGKRVLTQRQRILLATFRAVTRGVRYLFLWVNVM